MPSIQNKQTARGPGGGMLVTRIGHYGCSVGERIVRVRPPRGEDIPHWTAVWGVDCPACGTYHAVKPMFRQATEWERHEAELTLPKKQLGTQKLPLKIVSRRSKT